MDHSKVLQHPLLFYQINLHIKIKEHIYLNSICYFKKLTYKLLQVNQKVLRFNYYFYEELTISHKE